MVPPELASSLSETAVLSRQFRLHACWFMQRLMFYLDHVVSDRQGAFGTTVTRAHCKLAQGLRQNEL